MGQKDNHKGRGGVDAYYILMPDGTKVNTNLVPMPEGQLLRLGREERWSYVAEQRLAHWMGEETGGRAVNTQRWGYVERYSRMLGVVNPLAHQIAVDLGLVDPIQVPAPAVGVSMDAFGV